MTFRFNFTTFYISFLSFIFIYKKYIYILKLTKICRHHSQLRVSKLKQCVLIYKLNGSIEINKLAMKVARRRESFIKNDGYNSHTAGNIEAKIREFSAAAYARLLPRLSFLFTRSNCERLLLLLFV